ncbi:Hypothetical protein, putative [Bodo saltans]|uniref:Uncharacterized protein n=1 Tax=Bodo saltans TaxID=75058 RepID=A0A0S4KK60_BODSA|nr:Hypothetical protein, putative [Bodo saltans]|eukprot:CUI11278.1 Hypothetical protein, putative [Bodo saltans]
MSHADSLWTLDERLSDDPCSVWLSSRHTGHKEQTSTSTQLLNDVNVCQARQWGPRLLKLLPHNIPRISSSSAPSTVEEPLHWNQKQPVTAPSQNSKVPPTLQGIIHRASPSHLHSEAVTVHVSTEKDTTHIRLPLRLHGYIQPLTPWDDAIRFLVAGASPRAQDLASPFQSTNDGAMVVLPSWKCRGSASLLQQYGYLHAQFWPSSSSAEKRQQGSDAFPWAASVGLHLHHAIVRRRDHRPLLSTLEVDAVHDGQPFSSQWLKSCGIGLEVIPSRDPRWTLRSALHQLAAVDPLLRLARNSNTSSCGGIHGIDDASRSSSRQYSVGASYDSTTQRSLAGRFV